MSAIFDSFLVSGNAVFDSSFSVPVEMVLVTDIDAGNASSTASSVLYGYSNNPEVWIDARPAATTGTNGAGWRQMLFALDGAEGKTPLFKINRATRTSTTAPGADWLPLYTTDFVTWHRASSKTLVGGSTGHFEFSFDTPFPAGRVYVATNPIKPHGYANTFAAELLASYSTVASPTSSANASGVFFTSPAEVDENARQIGGHPLYSIKLAWGGATTDGGPKRKLVMFAGLHSQGEHSSWVSCEAAIRWMLDDTSPSAVAFRANWDVYLYFNLTPNGIYGGHRRHNFARSADPNRSFVVGGTPGLVEVAALQTAALADTSGAADALLSWHGYSSATKLFIPGTGSGPNQQTIDFIDIGKTVFGVGEYLEYYNTGSSYDFYWGYNALGCKVAFAAELQQSGNTSIATHELIGTNWAKTLQLTDAAGVFYAPPVTTHQVTPASSAVAVQSTRITVRPTVGMMATRPLAARVEVVTFAARVEVVTFAARVEVVTFAARIHATVMAGRAP